MAENNNHKADQANPNRGTNKAYDHVQGNRKQMNPNSENSKKQSAVMVRFSAENQYDGQFRYPVFCTDPQPPW